MKRSPNQRRGRMEFSIVVVAKTVALHVWHVPRYSSEAG
jgi:hypothetical protein